MRLKWEQRRREEGERHGNCVVSSLMDMGWASFDPRGVLVYGLSFW